MAADLDRVQATREYIDTVCRMAVLLTPEDVEELLDVMAEYDAIGPLLDPTAYRDARDVQKKREKVFIAFSKFHAVVREVWEEERLAALAGAKPHEGYVPKCRQGREP